MNAWKTVREMWQQTASGVQVVALLVSGVVLISFCWILRDIVVAVRADRDVVNRMDESGDDAGRSAERTQPESAADDDEGQTGSSAAAATSVAAVAPTSTVQRPGERTVAESFVLQLIEHIESLERGHREELARERDRAEKLHREELVRQDERFDELSATADGLRKRLDELGREQVRLAWKQVDSFKQQTALGIPIRRDLNAVQEQRGPAPQTQKNLPARRGVRPALEDDPFSSAQKRTATSRTAKRRVPRRSGYVNTSLKRRAPSGGYPPGSAKRRLREAEMRRLGAIRRTQIRRAHSGSSRVLGDLEAAAGLR